MVWNMLFIVLYYVVATKCEVLYLGQSDTLFSNKKNVCHPKRFLRYDWCLPEDYDKEDEPFRNLIEPNNTLPWNYDYTFKILQLSLIHI